VKLPLDNVAQVFYPATTIERLFCQEVDMSAYPTQAQRWSFPTQLGDGFRSQLARIPRHRGFVFGLMLVGALLAFEAFNYGTT